MRGANTIFLSVVAAIRHVCGTNRTDIRSAKRLHEDLGISRKELFQIAGVLESKHHIALFDPDVLQVLTVGALVTLVERELRLLEVGDGVLGL